MLLRRKSLVAMVSLVAVSAMATAANAQKKYDPGASDSEIKIGNIMPYSGPASAYGTIGKAQAAYFNKINAEGGINGRKINFISYDDAYSPPKAVEQARKLVESDEVLLTFQIIGTPSNAAVQRYLNGKKVPQLLAASGATRFSDPKNAPWTIGFNPNYQSEARIYAKYILQQAPNAKVAVLYQNDDSGRDYFKGIKDGLGAAADKMLTAVTTYEVTDPTIDSQIVSLQQSGADAFFMTGIPKFDAMAIRKAYDIGWKPKIFFISSTGSSVATGIVPAGPDQVLQGNQAEAYATFLAEGETEVEGWEVVATSYPGFEADLETLTRS